MGQQPRANRRTLAWVIGIVMTCMIAFFLAISQAWHSADQRWTTALQVMDEAGLGTNLAPEREERSLIGFVNTRELPLSLERSGRVRLGDLSIFFIELPVPTFALRQHSTLFSSVLTARVTLPRDGSGNRLMIRRWLDRVQSIAEDAGVPVVIEP